MSAFPQFANSPEQPGVPPPSVPASIRPWRSEESTKQPKPLAPTVPFKFAQGQASSQGPCQHLPATAWEKAYFIDCQTILDAIDARIKDLEYLKPPELIHEFQAFPWGSPRCGLRPDLALNELERAYVFDDRTAVAAFIDRNRLRQLLLEAREPLNAAFGEATVKRLALVEDDEGFTTLFCLMLVPGDMVWARLVLKSFDERWWLIRSGQAGGRLNFDFELI